MKIHTVFLICPAFSYCAMWSVEAHPPASVVWCGIVLLYTSFLWEAENEQSIVCLIVLVLIWLVALVCIMVGCCVCMCEWIKDKFREGKERKEKVLKQLICFYLWDCGIDQTGSILTCIHIWSQASVSQPLCSFFNDHHNIKKWLLIAKFQTHITWYFVPKRDLMHFYNPVTSGP